MDKVYENFVAFMEAEVLPRLLQNPQHARLDGWTESKGNWTVVALFRHDGHVPQRLESVFPSRLVQPPRADHQG